VTDLEKQISSRRPETGDNIRSKEAKRLRILVYTSLFPNSIHPLTGNFVLERMRYLSQLVDISVIAPIPYFPSWIRFGPWRNWARVPRSEQFGGFQTEHPRYLVFPKLGMATHGLSMFAGSFRKVCERLKAAEYDLIDAHYVYPDGLAATLLASALNKPVVVSARGSDINLFSEFTTIRPLIRQVLRRSHGLIAVSQELKEKMLRLGCQNENLAVVANGVDPQKFKPKPRLDMRQKLGLPQDGPIVLSVGRLDENKGCQILINAIARLQSPKVTLLIIGEGPRRVEMETQIRELGLKRSVRLVGTIPHDELGAWYNAADVFCLASLREGCPNVVLEAMACGRPVVATHVGGIPELVVSPTLGTLVKRTPEAFASALREALRKTWDQDAIAAHARSHGWDRVSAQIMDVYSKALTQFHAKS
jgi:glycosyltransferase involved in cell wall biosynthesis